MRSNPHAPGRPRAGQALGVALLCAAAAGCPESRSGRGAEDAGPLPDGTVLDPCANGLLDGEESDTDCGGGQCLPCAAGRGCVVPGDCASTVCRGRVCQLADTCADGVPGELETDVDCGGPLCDPCGVGARCDVDRDCATARCEEERCVPACDDGLRNGDESDVDCGGGCEPCAVGAACRRGADCAAGVCRGGACLAPSCDDAVRNGDETGPDCGGPTCATPCPAGAGCAVDGDCASRVCRDGACVATTCANGARDGDETDVDCGGASCPGCAVGGACGASADCDGAVCAEGVCAAGASCLALLEADPTLPSGTYHLDPSGVGAALATRCDMEADGGGWTLVGATRDVTLDDAALAHHADLATLTPEAGHPGVWDGLRPLMDGAADLRFACRRDATAAGNDVDLVVYRTPWYRTITAGTDAQSCFSPSNGAGYTRPAPARRDLRAGVLLRRGDDWNAGFLEGEDSCDDVGDFTVDLDDRGMDGDEADGTDWGEDDGARKCGEDGLSGGVWLLWARERGPRCADGLPSPGESDVDCGGPCAPCAEDATCLVDGDCDASDDLECGPAGTCVGPCDNGRRNGDETDVDCGGSCATGCGLRAGCAVDADCADGRSCLAGRCHPSSCADGALGGDETAVDCGGSCPRCAAGVACLGAADCLTGSCASGTCRRLADCGAIHAETGTLPDEVYEIAPAGVARRVWCDMTADGGGWTLVGSTRTFTLNDQSSGWYAELETLFPTAARSGLWSEMRSVIATTSDVRFACKVDPTSSELDVDLVVYDVGWYREWTTGTDAASCFSEGDGAGADATAPARADLVAGLSLPAADAWDADGYLEGEDTCGDTFDFTVDLDDRGMDSDESDGTDWGEDDGTRKCGRAGLSDGAWFVFVR